MSTLEVPISYRSANAPEFNNLQTGLARILCPVDFDLLRKKVKHYMREAGLNPTQLAGRAAVNQSNVARWLRDDTPAATDMTARVLFQIIEQGLDMSLPAFFGPLENTAAKDTETVKAALTQQQIATHNLPRTHTRVGGEDGTPGVQPAADPRTIFATLGRALIEAGARLGGSGLTVEQLDRSFLDAARKKPKRGRRRSPNR